MVAVGFGQRRKMLRRALAHLASASELESLGIDPTDRAEDLDLAEWAAIATLVESKR